MMATTSLAIRTRGLSDEHRDVLLALPVFAAVSEEEQGHAFSLLKRRQYRRGEVVYHQDDPPGSLFIVVRGAVKMERTLDNGRRHTIAWITRGNFFGTHSMFGIATRTEDAVAITACELLVFRGEEFRDFLHRNPAAMEALLEMVIRKWRTCMERFSESVLLDAPERTARVLLRLMERFGLEEGNGVVALPHLTQPELASWVGASRETVNRILKSLATRRLIEVRGGVIHILDVEGLDAYAAPLV